MNRTAWLLQGCDLNSRILELGASYSPIAPKAAGWRTHVVDHASRDELRTKYAAEGVGVDAVEEVDTIWRGEPLDTVLPPALLGTFDTLIASHVVEHLPDLIGFLNAVERLLRPSGTIALAIPDRRYCFDFFKPVTLTGDVLEAHAAGRRRHAPHTVWNQKAYSVFADGVGAWGHHQLRDITFTKPFAEAEQDRVADAADAGRPYRDCHAWHFTPASFRLVMLELGQIGAVNWRIDDLDAPWGAEFLCRLRRGAERVASEQALQARRMSLLMDLLAEQRDQLDCALGQEGRTGSRSPANAENWGALAMLRRAS